MNNRILVVVCLFASLLLGEAVARFGFGLGTPPLSITHPTIEYMFSPNQRVYRFRNLQIYNEYGMRSVSMADVRQPRRILVFGDSVVNGGSLTDHGELATTLGSNSDTFFGNVSAGSWGPANMTAWINEFGLLGADTAVVVLSSHDIMDLPTFAELNPLTHPTKKPASALLEGIHRYFPRYLNSARQFFAEGSSTKLNSELTLKDPAEGVANLTVLIDQFVSENVRACLILHQTKTELRNGPAPGHQIMKNLFSARGVPVFDLGKAMLDTQSIEFEAYHDEIHINALGQRILSKYLQQCAELAAVPTS